MLIEILDRLELLKEITNDTRTAQRISQVAAFRVIAEYKQRIFTQGLDTFGNQIGSYSTNPFYINPNSPTLIGVASSGIKPEGKTGKTVFKSGKPHKSKYLSEGYSELRQLTGRQNETVDLNFSGSLERSVKVIENANVATVTYTIDSEAEKMIWNETRFGTEIHTVSDEERNAGSEAGQLEFLAILEENDIQ
jgi:hypothetical protein